MAFTTWDNYRRGYYSNFLLPSLKEDVCNACIQLKCIIADKDSSDADKEFAQQALDFHRETAMVQRKSMVAVMKVSVPVRQHKHHTNDSINAATGSRHIQRRL